MNTTLKKTIKLASGVCAALGVVTLGAVMASGVAVKVVAEGIRAGVDGMKKTIAELQTESESTPVITEEKTLRINISQTFPKTFHNNRPLS